MLLVFAVPLLMCTTTCTERECRLQHYLQVVAYYITLQTICSLMVSITGLPRTGSDGVAYQDLKEPRYIIEKNAMSIFMLNVSSYVSKSRTVCVFKIEKRKLHTKK